MCAGNNSCYTLHIAYNNIVLFHIDLLAIVNEVGLVIIRCSTECFKNIKIMDKENMFINTNSSLVFSCRVIETKNSEFTVGDLVFGNFGWVTHTICNGNPEGHPHGLRKLDPNSPISPSTAVGILGMPG